MSSPVVIVDYGMGNLHSIIRKIHLLGYSWQISNQPEIVCKAEKLILPGVGHFGKAMEKLQQLHLTEALHEAVIQRKIPVLGICLGMQLMARFSEEGNTQGLGWFDAQVIKFQITDTSRYKIPHIGWNQVFNRKTCPIMQGIEDGTEFYFVHSYHWKTEQIAHEVHQTIYEYPFTSAIAQDNIFGVQYHPEKSYDSGLILLDNFLKLK
jgi:glutamine amidotransferase